LLIERLAYNIDELYERQAERDVQWRVVMLGRSNGRVVVLKHRVYELVLPTVTENACRTENRHNVT